MVRQFFLIRFLFAAQGFHCIRSGIQEGCLDILCVAIVDQGGILRVQWAACQDFEAILLHDLV